MAAAVWGVFHNHAFRAAVVTLKKNVRDCGLRRGLAAARLHPPQTLLQAATLLNLLHTAAIR